MRVIGEPLADVGFELVERIDGCLLADAGLAFANQVSLDRFAVVANMAGNGRDRPPSHSQCCDLHVFLWCQHQSRGSSRLQVWSWSTTSIERNPTPTDGYSEGEEIQ